jgi:hypothetical protein
MTTLEQHLAAINRPAPDDELRALNAAYVRAQGRKAGQVAARARRQVTRKHGPVAGAEWQAITDTLLADTIGRMKATGVSDGALAEFREGFAEALEAPPDNVSLLTRMRRDRR